MKRPYLELTGNFKEREIVWNQLYRFGITWDELPLEFTINRISSFANYRCLTGNVLKLSNMSNPSLVAHYAGVYSDMIRMNSPRQFAQYLRKYMEFVAKDL